MYYPGMNVEENLTRLGSVESTHPTLYDAPIAGKKLVKFDALDVLRDKWGDSVLYHRGRTYKLVSGACSIEEYRDIMVSYYKKYPTFKAYIDAQLEFGDPSVDAMQRLVKDARDAIDARIEEYKNLIVANKGKFVMMTHDYVYGAFPDTTDCSTFNGTVIT
jgi:hypothetical protein